MKTIIKTLILSGVLLFMAFSCEKIKYENIPVEYKKCPCDHETEFAKTIKYENILLFDSSKISFSDMKEISFDGEKSIFMRYSESGTLTVYIVVGNTAIFHVCNPPVSVLNKIQIPKKGIMTEIEGDLYNSCSEPIIPESASDDIVLTSFKIQKL